KLIISITNKKIMPRYLRSDASSLSSEKICEIIDSSDTRGQEYPTDLSLKNIQSSGQNIN
ncbi:2077_t:CDS:2, partial [Funneliformis geosporum]